MVSKFHIIIYSAIILGLNLLLMLMNISSSLVLVPSLCLHSGASTTLILATQSPRPQYGKWWSQFAERNQVMFGMVDFLDRTQMSSLGSHQDWIRNAPKPSIGLLLINTSNFLGSLFMNMTYQWRISGIWMKRAVSEVEGVNPYLRNALCLERDDHVIRVEVTILNWLLSMNVSQQMVIVLDLALYSLDLGCIRKSGLKYILTSGNFHC